ELGTRNQELEQPPRYGSHLNRRPESRIKSIGWPPSIEQSPSTLRDTPGFSLRQEGETWYGMAAGVRTCEVWQDGAGKKNGSGIAGGG
ncbi:MAG: hypothetical protein V2A73_07975, partial [Pseudomonadota bacterium]